MGIIEEILAVEFLDQGCGRIIHRRSASPCPPSPAMRLLNGGNPPPPPIGARRGIRRKGSAGPSEHLILNHRSILVLLALCATIFATGLVLGTRVFGTLPHIDGGDGHRVAESSPLAAATSKLIPKNVQDLILESARAEVEERREKALEERAMQRGDYKTAAHLRGELVPGDANYNPHHRIDDAFFGGDEGGGGGDGGMYAGDRGDHGEGEVAEADEAGGDGGENNNMRHHLLDAVKNEVRRDGKRIVEGMHDLKERVRDVANDVVRKKLENHGLLRGGGGRGHDGGGGDDGHSSKKTSPAGHGGKSDEEGLRYYPYMTVAVPADYDFSRYEPLGGGRYAEYKDGDAPYDVTDRIAVQSDELARSRRHHVGGAMRHVWKNYKERAFGNDEIKPISGGTTNKWGGMGTT